MKFISKIFYNYNFQIFLFILFLINTIVLFKNLQLIKMFCYIIVKKYKKYFYNSF